MRVIPNAVGRLDPVTDAIREGDWDLANKLLFQEQARLKARSDSLVAENRRVCDDWDYVGEFLAAIGDKDAWDRARKECGWDGGQHEEMK